MSPYSSIEPNKTIKQTKQQTKSTNKQRTTKHHLQSKIIFVFPSSVVSTDLSSKYFEGRFMGEKEMFHS